MLQNMGKVLVVAEKPSAGADMAKVLGCHNRNNGYMESEKYIVTWAVGHLIGLKMPEEHHPELKKWKMEDLPLVFDIKDSLKVLPDTKAQFEVIKKLIHRRDVDYIINAGDAGREGYLIQSWIYRYAGNTKPVKILWASSLTDEALRKAFGSLKEEDSAFRNLLQEAEARAEADYLMGMNYSRILTLLKSRDITLSYGRCQTPLLNLIVQRDLEIENFQPMPFYQLQIKYSQEFNGICIGEDGKAKNFENREDAEAVINSILGASAEVLQYERKEKKQKAPYLYSLGELQKDMGRRYQYTPDKTLETAQRLYETYKMISYPRTDSRYLSMDLYNEIGEHIKSCRFGKFKEKIEKIDLNGIKADKSYFNDAKVTDHHALIPTINENIEEAYQKLTEEERNVFDAVTWRFLAIFYPEYEYAAATLITKIKDILFLSRGVSIKNPGYKELLGWDKKELEDSEKIPCLNLGDRLEAGQISLLSRKTTPPPKYTIESLITAMQAHSIGTPATMAEIIKKLLNPGRQFAVLEEGSYHSTSFGRKYIAAVPEHLKSSDLTKNIEEKLAQIGSGTYTKEEFLQEIIQQIKNDTASLKTEYGTVIERTQLGTCPICGNPVREERFNYSCGTEGCFRTGKNICGKEISAKTVQDLLTKGKTGIIKGFTAKSGKKFNARLVLKGNKAEFEFVGK